ncbi:Dihydrogeodin oxidase [Colletotrichum sp. SAR 10_71]|nr:Dihydrogeodin oxidase [Colletotrichum sp. SAR 10_71]KAJ5003385.1 Dihydrogeodin oxidase [Colletotrichum sp. SAR 10_66]
MRSRPPRGKYERSVLLLVAVQITHIDSNQFYLVASNEEIAPDGYKVQRITVYNNLTNYNGTSIHWHGIRQLNTNWMDGVSGVTECPIPKPKENITYEWKAQQYGVSWYHSRPPSPDSMLMNGKGKYHCCSKCPRADKNCVGGSERESFNFKKGKTYKMSLVNTATSTHTTFWIDKHNFTVVAADFVPIKPYVASIINVAIGQRYDIIIEANATDTDTTETDFWIHARDCSIGGAPSNLGIIRYDPESTYIPHTPPVDDRHVCYGCLDELAKDLVPMVKRTVDAPANANYQNESFKVHLVGYPDETAQKSDLHKWVLKDSSLYLDWSEPSLSLAKVAFDKDWKRPRFPPGYEPVYLEQPQGKWVYWLIEGKFQESVDNSTKKIYKTQAPVAHPMHIHGHDFVILAQSDKELNGTIDIPKERLDNPARRDVALLPVNGYLLIAFEINNPGIWLMHCHIAWHASGGLALQFIESPDKIGPMFKDSGRVPQFSETCTNWAAHYTLFNKNHDAEQDDSGI